MINLSNVIAAGDPNGVHLAGDILEVYWGSAAFACVAAVFLWKGLGPLKKALNSRTEKFETQLASAETAKAEAAAQLEAKSAEMGDVGAERARIRREAVETSEKLKVDLIQKAHTDAANIVSKAKNDVQNLKNQASSDIASELGEMTKATTEATIKSEMNDGSQTDLIESYITQVGQLT